MSNVVTVAWARYLRQLEREPLKTKARFGFGQTAISSQIPPSYAITSATAMQAITSGSLAALSDITAQMLVSNAPLNWRRTVAMALFGLIWSGPSNHYWQKFTNQLFKGKKDAASIAQKVCIFAALLQLHLLNSIKMCSWFLRYIVCVDRFSLTTWCTAQSSIS